jgi:divalent metal cation (Fe/Co/Zn/Cd) transporter
MSDPFPIADLPSCCAPSRIPRKVLRLQGITLSWMLAECAVSLHAAYTAHSAALLAFGSDSLVELLSASVVLLSFVPSFPMTSSQASRWAGILLFVLAAAVAATAVLSLVYGVQPALTRAGIVITAAALVVMPLLAWFKRRVAQATSNRALAADAVQSGTCAYLAAITLAGLVVNAMFRIGWIDAAAALVALPILISEGRKAIRGENCGCC